MEHTTKKTTQELAEILKASPSIDDYLDGQRESLSTCTLAEALNAFATEKHLQKSDIIKRCGLDRAYAYQIFSGEKTPARDKVLALAFGMRLSPPQVQTLLKTSGYPPLYPRIERDACILFAFEKGLGITDANELLYDLGLKLVE